MSKYYDDYYNYPASTPREAKGGIKAQTQHGAFGNNWWSKTWIKIIEGFPIGGRLARGKRYARSGQILSIDIQKGTVEASVQGSQIKPYKVIIKFDRIAGDTWEQIVKNLLKTPLFMAQLLNGEMPESIDEVFQQSKTSLFPSQYKSISMKCSCPDYSVPCKHIAAVFYLLGEEFERDPFLLFTLRGMPKDELLNCLKPAQTAVKPDSADDSCRAREPLADSIKDYWKMGELPEDFHGAVRMPQTHAGIVKSLGKLPLWRGTESFLDTLQVVYGIASKKGFRIFMGEQTPENGE